MASYDELDATLTRVADQHADAVADVVRVVRGDSAGEDRTPTEAVRVLNGWYLRQQATDAGVRAVPGRMGGMVGALRPEPMASLDRTMVYLLALASLHGVDLDDPERRKALLVAVLLGDEGARLATSAVAGSGSGPAWARRLVSVPRAGNPLLGQLVGAALNTGLAVALAAGGESIQARAVVAQARRAFGDPPASFPGQNARTSRPVAAGPAPSPSPGPPPRPVDRSALGPAAAEPMTTGSVYARALARTWHKAKQKPPAS